MNYNRLTVSIDFDGVLCKFAGWKGEFVFDEPIEGAKEFLKHISKVYRVVVHTARPDIAEVYKWLNKHGMVEFIDSVSNTKEPSIAYIDDRAICFTGDFIDLKNKLGNFAPWWEKN